MPPRPETATETWSRALARATAELDAAGCDTPRLDAELLLAEALGITRTQLYLGGRAVPLTPHAARRFSALLARRIAREPIAYILGRREFRRLSLAVDPRVLIPRPETELLVEATVELAPRGARVADVGTGSGAVALALADERPDLEVVGIDTSVDALAVARENGRALGLPVRFYEGDLLTVVTPGALDAVIANLPYVPDGTSLQIDVSDHEPGAALFGGPDGLDVIRRLCAQLAADAAQDVSLIALEIGFDQGPAAAALVEAAGFADVSLRRDLAGHDRVVVGRR